MGSTSGWSYNGGGGGGAVEAQNDRWVAVSLFGRATGDRRENSVTADRQRLIAG